MPDYNPAVAAGIRPPENDFGSTFGKIANIQAEQARTNLYTLQGLQQQRQYNGLMAAAEAFRTGQDPVAAAAPYGLDPAMLNQFQSLQENKRAQATNPWGISPEHANQAAEFPAKQKADAAQAANSYFASGDPTAVFQHAAKFSDNPLGVQGLVDLYKTDRNKFDQVVRAGAGSGLTAEQGAATVETETPQGAKQYQTRAQFLAGGPQTGQTQEAKEEAQKRGAALGEYLPKVQDEAAAAKQMNFTLGQMEDESKGFTLGAYAPHLTTFAKYMKPLANSVGDTTFDNWVGTNEDFAKNAGVLARQGVREISNRPSQMEFQIVANQMPHDAMSQQGFQGIVDQFRAVNDFKQAKAFAAQKWQDTKGTMKGFEADWNSHIGPAAFMIANMSPEQRQKLSVPQAQRDSITRQLKWAHENGLENGIQ